jgi:hypothetical protein
VRGAVVVFVARDRASVELRIGEDLAVRIDAVERGVAMIAEASRPVPPAAEPPRLVEAVRARGVPVVRAELRARRPPPRGGAR